MRKLYEVNDYFCTTYKNNVAIVTNKKEAIRIAKEINAKYTEKDLKNLCGSQIVEYYIVKKFGKHYAFDSKAVAECFLGTGFGFADYKKIDGEWVICRN